MAPASGRHYHRDDFPETLCLLEEVLARGCRTNVTGFESTSHGAWVDWPELELENPWSSSERGVLMLTEALSIIESAHGAGPLAGAVTDAVGRVV